MKPLRPTMSYYGAVSIEGQARVTLTAGAYGFTSLQMESQTVLVIDDSAGPIRIYVQTKIVYSGSVVRQGGGQPALLLAQMGSSGLTLNSPFAGVIVAPNAPLTLGRALLNLGGGGPCDYAAWVEWSTDFGSSVAS